MTIWKEICLMRKAEKRNMAESCQRQIVKNGGRKLMLEDSKKKKCKDGGVPCTFIYE